MQPLSLGDVLQGSVPELAIHHCRSITSGELGMRMIGMIGRSSVR
jgi:hypothetical protein